ncbi:MAG TPA: protein kinase [Polyangia bacterium]|nr:protein kinase [Polyangia bacterium]
MACSYESAVGAYLAGGLAEEERARFEAHLPGCAACTRAAAAGLRGAPEAGRSGGPPADAGVLGRGARMGRYIILSLLGRGGMGDVYAAYDPRLDRKVALKLLNERAPGAATPAARERLLREAQATARLSHRNVVVVYDAGTVEDGGTTRVYLAMELVDGQTLAAWLVEKPRTWREVRDLFAAAGEGLLAAHEAGLVHRDFKPQNVMVGRDGAARVLDFGLAGDGPEAGEEPAIDLTSGEVPTAQTIALTHTGVLLGTPLYMAPEQFLGGKSDARTDQFSFCVALYEALTRERPFASGTFAELVAAVTTGQARQSPKQARVPAFLQRVLRRGLSADPASRFPSMRELLTALRTDPLRHRRSLVVGALAGVAVIAAVAGAQRIATRGQRFCRGAGEKLQGSWELDPAGPRHVELHRAFVASGSPIVGETWPRVSALLDDYFRKWTTAYTDTCEATHVRGDQSDEVLDLRMTCLDGERGALQALTDVFSHADARAVVEAVNAVNALPGIDRCADVAGLRAVVPPPADRTVRARVSALEAQLTEIKALTDTGQWSAAYDKVRPLTEAARTTGYSPLVAEALATQSWLSGKLGDVTISAKLYEETVWLALSAHRDDLAAEAAAQMVSMGLYIGLAEAQSWEPLTRALIRRLGPGHERIAAWFHQNRAVELGRSGNFTEAVPELSLALSLKRKALPPNHPDIGISLFEISAFHSYLGEGREALSFAQEAFDIFRTAYGSRSPILWEVLDNRGAALRTLHLLRDSEKDLRASVDLATELMGPDDVLTSDPLTELGKTLVAEKKYREAVPVLTSAVRLLKPFDPNSTALADARFPLAQARWAIGQDLQAARALAVAALNTYRSLPGYKKWADEVQAWLSDKPDPGHHATQNASR